MDVSNVGEPIGNWQPIHTAPRDGTIVLVVRADFDARPHCAAVNENGDWSSHEEFFLKNRPPTHWMPLPKVPHT